MRTKSSPSVFLKSEKLGLKFESELHSIRRPDSLAFMSEGDDEARRAWKADVLANRRVKRPPDGHSVVIPVDLSRGIKPALRECEALLLEHYLELGGGKSAEAAQRAGLPLPTFYRRVSQTKARKDGRESGPLVRGVMLSSFFHAASHLQLSLLEREEKEPIEPGTWYPVAAYERLTGKLDSMENAAQLKQAIGEEMMRGWYHEGPGASLVRTGVEFLRYQSSSEGYYSMVKGTPGQIGSFSLQAFDRPSGRASVYSTTPLDRDIERGVLLGGMRAPGDLRRVEVKNSPDPDHFQIFFEEA